MERLFEALVEGDREAARGVVTAGLESGLTARELIGEVFWPTYELIERLHRADQMTRLAHQLATRLLRVLVDQVAARLEREAPVGRRVFAICGAAEEDELGAQMAVDLLEASGYEVTFAGGSVANDEILAWVQRSRPHVLLAFCSAANDLPEIRRLIDTLHEIGACPDLQVVVGGGVFNRAEGLAEEIGADLWAGTPMELVEAMAAQPERRAAPEQRTVGRKRRKRTAA